MFGFMAIMSQSVARLIFKTGQLYQFGDVRLEAHRHVHKAKNNKRSWDEKKKNPDKEAYIETGRWWRPIKSQSHSLLIFF